MANLSSFISSGLLNAVANSKNTPVVTSQQRASNDTINASVQNDLKKAGLSTGFNLSDEFLNDLTDEEPKGPTFNTTVDGKQVRVVDGVTQTDDPDDIVVTAQPRSKPLAVGDNRLRLSALPGLDNERRVYGPNEPNNIMAPLHGTGGMLFPYTPSIQISGEATWTTHDLVHTNFDILSYERTPSATIGITGKFTVQNQREGAYALAVIHFLRTMTKMHYGDQESRNDNAQENAGKPAIAGLPPPVLRLRGYGSYMFPDLRCVLKSFNFNFDDNMDLIPIQLPDGEVLLPPMFSITIGVGLQQSTSRVRRDFNLEQFRTGASMKTGNFF